MTNQELSIIITTYNSQEVILTTLQNINFDKYQVLIVDNNSQDNTILLATNHFPKVNIIKSNGNIGYGRANNLGLKKVETEFALILNPDCQILQKDIEIMISSMKQNNKIALTAPLLIDKYRNHQNEINYQKELENSNNNNIANILFTNNKLSGACLLMRMSIFRNIGFFDENIFLFYEDDEIALRARKNNFYNAIINNAFAIHLEGSSTEKNHRNIFRRNWHLKGWSKNYWKKINKGIFSAKRSALRLFLLHFFKAIFYLLIYRKTQFIENIAASLGSLAFLIGMNAFNSKGNGRG